jgi:hypothetical protein
MMISVRFEIIMKMVFTNRSIIPCDLLKCLLEAEDISSVIRNEYGTHLLSKGLPVPGGSALIWAWPQIWIEESDVPNAEPLINDFQKSMEKDTT